VPWEVIELIKRISRENPTWGAPASFRGLALEAPPQPPAGGGFLLAEKALSDPSGSLSNAAVDDN
jgi:hypothetical protein